MSRIRPRTVVLYVALLAVSLLGATIFYAYLVAVSA